jgi:hypothetical protein
MKALSSVLVGILIATASLAAVDVQKAGNFPSSVEGLAIAPLNCTEDVNCVKIEKHLDKSVAKQFPAKVVGTAAVKQALFDASVVEPTKEAIIEAARTLGCNAIMLPSILGSSRKGHHSAWTEWDTGKTHETAYDTVMSSVQVIIIDLDGKLLMKGQASGESTLQTEQTYFAENQLDKILRKALK